MSQAAAFTASNDLPAPSITTSSSGTPRRRASSRARSTVTPHGAPVTGLRCTSTGLPMLMAARSVPVGASDFTTSADGVLVTGSYS